MQVTVLHILQQCKHLHDSENPSAAQALASVALSDFQHESMLRKKIFCCSSSLALCFTLIFYHCRTAVFSRIFSLAEMLRALLQTTKLHRRVLVFHLI